LSPRPAAVVALLSLSLAVTAGCGAEAIDPWIEAILPDHAPVGEVVEVVGERFSGQVRNVAFGGHPAQVLNWGDRRARTRVPDAAGLSGATVVVVTVDGRPSNPVSFVVE
jgi:hypothetical protein